MEQFEYSEIPPEGRARFKLGRSLEPPDRLSAILREATPTIMGELQFAQTSSQSKPKLETTPTV